MLFLIQIILQLVYIDFTRGIIWFQAKPSSTGWLMASFPSYKLSSCIGQTNGHSFQGFSCPRSKRCFPLSWRCDGNEDCPDGEDERNCRYPIRPTYPSDSGNPRCRIGELGCVASNGRDVCLNREKVCDGHVDCYDGWDENVANCQSICSFRCSPSGPCLNENRRCDGIRDCFDGADERYCNTNLNNVHEHHEEIDEEDEDEDDEDHDTSFCHHEYEYKCWASREKKCIARAWVCDGHDDCPEGEDEEDCHEDHHW